MHDTYISITRASEPMGQLALLNFALFIWNKGKSLNIKCCSFITGPRKLLIFWSPNQSNVVPLWLDPLSYSYFDAQPDQRGFFYDCPPKLLTFRRPCNSIWNLEFWRRNRRKRQSHKILISIICRSELELRNFTNFKWIIMGQLLRGFLKDGV